MRLILSVWLFFFLTSQLTVAKENTQDFIVPSTSLGKIRLWETSFAEAKKTFGKSLSEVEVGKQGYPYLHYGNTQRGSQLFIGFAHSEPILYRPNQPPLGSAILVDFTSSAFKTSDGMGVSNFRDHLDKFTTSHLDFGTLYSLKTGGLSFLELNSTEAKKYGFKTLGMLQKESYTPEFHPGHFFAILAKEKEKQKFDEIQAAEDRRWAPFPPCLGKDGKAWENSVRLTFAGHPKLCLVPDYVSKEGEGEMEKINVFIEGKTEKPVQSFDVEIKDAWPRDVLTIQDMNGDGFNDLFVLTFSSRSLMNRDLYLYDPKTEKFQRENLELHSPVFSPATKEIIETWEDSNLAPDLIRSYRYQAGHFKLVQTAPAKSP